MTDHYHHLFLKKKRNIKETCFHWKLSLFSLSFLTSQKNKNRTAEIVAHQQAQNRFSNKMASTGDIWLQWFTCCFHQPQSPSRRRHQRLRIDRTMIGNPTNFQHTGHIGSADVELTTNHLNAIQTQMQSKGGYEMSSIRVQACW